MIDGLFRAVSINYEESPIFPTYTMLSGWRRFLPGKRRNRREDQPIRAIPISEAGPLLHEEDTDLEMPDHYPRQYVVYLASLFIDDSKPAVIFSLPQPCSIVSLYLCSNFSTDAHRNSEPNLNIDYGRFQEGITHSM